MALFGKKKDPAKLHFQGVNAFENGQLEVAHSRFSDAIKIEPTSERLYYRGVIHDLMGKPKDALKDLKQSVKLDPKNSQALYSLSIIYAQQEIIEGAYESVKQAYEIDPDDFRIANHFAMLMLNSPITEHQDPRRAVEISKHACELTEWEDEICLATHEQALAAVGNESEAANVSEQREAASNESFDDVTFEIIAHFEKRFKRTANERSLQNIVPPASTPVAVQTIESSGKGPSVVFTTGLSSQALNVAEEDKSYRFAELMMVIPGDWKFNETMDEKIWPWLSLQHLAYQARLTETGFTRQPQVISLGSESEPSPDGFSAFLLLPSLKGYVERMQASNGRIVGFITVVPIYHEEYELAKQQGVAELFKRFRETKMKPHFIPNRKNLGI